MFTDNLIVYLASFVALWFGAGLIVTSVEKFSKKLKVSSFAISFFLLGLLTSIPELAVGLTAISEHKAEIFVGNLLGGITIIFLLIIPLLAVLGNGVKLSNHLNNTNIIVALVVIALPSLLILDKRVTNLEGVVMIIAYLVLFYFIERRKGVFDVEESEILEVKSYSLIDIIKILVGVIIIFIFSGIAVDKTIYFSELLNISPFYMSLILLSLGTNVPEFSLAVRSVISGKKDVAMGDYIGSAAVNTLLFGVFTLLHSGEVITGTNFIVTFIFIIAGTSLFYYFSYLKQSITRKEGIVLLVLYIAFIVLEVLRV